jgi:hypothetical protein
MMTPSFIIVEKASGCNKASPEDVTIMYTLQSVGEHMKRINKMNQEEET